MLLLTLCLLAPQIDPIFNQYSVKIEDKIAYFGQSVTNLFQYSNGNFVLVNNDLYSNGNFTETTDRPVVLEPYIFVPRIGNTQEHIGYVDVLKIIGSHSEVQTPIDIESKVVNIKIDKYSDSSIVCALDSIEFRTITVIEVSNNGQRVLGVLPYHLFGNDFFVLSRIIVLDQNRTKYVYLILYPDYPAEKAIIYNLNTGIQYVEYGFSRNSDIVPAAFSLIQKSKWGTSDRLYFQQVTNVLGFPYTTEIKEFIPGFESNPLVDYQYYKTQSTLGFLGKCDGDFDGDGRQEAVITSYGSDNYHLIIRQYGPLDIYEQEFALVDDYRWVNDAISGDFNGDGKTDLVLQYGEYNLPNFKFLRGTKQLFRPSLVWD